ncbi:hypothetical protein [Roseicitreum antarcticum]|uniref:Uncharacterized protein n=1 Tax=Roseicitreum antarcticum TaxID=564137 RepID=A0A1H2W9D5_9RHOB|nr:hypothetical protein [Roseicitreum antarcticum]SDW77283.1 hypothetical protein SAMN04488238_103312 [Roseicitreum antarcticum]
MADDKNKSGVMLTAQQQVRVSLAMQRVAKMVDKELHKAAGEPVPFSLFTWGGGRSQYVANVERADAKTVMRETLARWDRHEPDLGPPHTDGKGETRQ